LEEQGVLVTLTDEVQKLKEEIEQAVVDSASKKHRQYRKLLGDNDDGVCDVSAASVIVCVCVVCRAGL